MGTNSGATTGINNKQSTGSAGGGVGVSGSGLGGANSGLGGGLSNNSNNSIIGNSGLGLGGGGGGGNNLSNAGGLGGGMTGSGNIDDGNGGSNVANNQQAAPQYTIPGVLHFIQHEWSRFELERSQWDVDRAELQVCFCSQIILKNFINKLGI